MALGFYGSAGSQVRWELIRPSNTGIPGEEVRVVRFGPDGKVWVGARWPFWREGGVGVLDVQGDTWVTYSNAETGSGRGPIPSPFVNDIEFAPGGVVWIATDGGAVRFDGENWQVYNSSNTPMAFDKVLDISIAPNGHVWINNSDFNLGGDALWEFDGSTWRSYRVGRDLPWPDPWQDLAGVLAASNGDVWVTNESLTGAARFRSGVWTLFGSSIGRFDEVVEDAAGNVWFAPGLSDVMLGKWDGQRFTGINVSTDVLTVATDTDGAVYYGNWAGVVRRSYDGGATWQTFASGLNQVYSVAPDPNGSDVWIGTIGAVGRFRGNGQWVKDYNTYTTGMPDYFIDDIHRGKVSGHTFVASIEAGVSQFDGVRWENRGSHNPNADWPVLADGADSVYEDRFGAVWIGTNGVARWNGESFDLWDWRNAPFGVTSFWDFAEDVNGTLFAFTKYGSAYRFHPATRTWTREPIQMYAVLGIPGAEADSLGNIYFGGWFDIAKWDGSTWRILQLPYSNFLYDLGGANDLTVAPDDTLWIGTQRGLVHYDGTRWTVYDRRNTPMVVTSVAGVAFRSDGVMGLALSNLDDRDNCAVAIVDGPIDQPTSWHIFRYGQSPLPHPQLGDVEFDTSGSLWVSAISEAVAVVHYPMSQPERATLTDLAVLDGRLIAGGVEQMRESDDRHAVLEARVTAEVSRPHLLQFTLGATSGVQSPVSMEIGIESRITDVAATAWVFLKDWNTGQFVQVGTFSVGMSERTERIGVSNGSRFRRASDGRVELLIREVVFFPMTLGGFHSWIDQVAIDVR